MGSLGPLPAIDVSMDQKAPKEASRSAESQADLDSELDSLHRELGVKRGVPPATVGRTCACGGGVAVDLHRMSHRRGAQGSDEAEARVPDAKGRAHGASDRRGHLLPRPCRRPGHSSGAR